MEKIRIKRYRTAKHRYTLTLWDTYKRDHHGKTILRYAFKRVGDRKPIFAGEDFACSPMHAIDSDACYNALMGFLTLRLGDTDAEYFDGYTPEQIAWRDSGEAEELSVLIILAEMER